jgi:hypothetical protein
VAGVVAGAEVAAAVGEETGVTVAVLDGEDDEEVEAEHAVASTAQQASSAPAIILPAMPEVDVM